MKRNETRGFTLVELMVVIGILGLLVGILAVAVLPRVIGARRDLEIKQMGDLRSAFQNMSIQPDINRRLQSPPLQGTQGLKFYEAAFRARIFEPDLVTKIVSLNSRTDSASNRAFIDDPEIPLQDFECSYTAPRAQDLLSVMNMQGQRQRVMVTFNARNWFNYQEHGVLVQWSDGPTAVYLTKDAAKSEYNIDTNLWDQKPEDIIGKIQPFERTFE